MLTDTRQDNILRLIQPRMPTTRWTKPFAIGMPRHIRNKRLEALLSDTEVPPIAAYRHQGQAHTVLGQWDNSWVALLLGNARIMGRYLSVLQHPSLLSCDRLLRLLTEDAAKLLCAGTAKVT